MISKTLNECSITLLNLFKTDMSKTKPINEYRFRLIDGAWREITEDAGILADVLGRWELDFDYRVQFARVYDYERGICFYYRVDSGLITLTLWRL